MNRIVSYIFAAISLSIALSACSKQNLTEPAWDGEGAVLTLSLSASESPVASKASSAYGEDKWNENTIKGFKLYFYNSESESNDTPAAYVWPENGWASVTNSGAVVSDGTSVSGETPSEGKVSVKFMVKKNIVSKLFTTLSSCRVYAVANVEGFGELPSSEYPTVNELKNIVIKTSFAPSLSEDPYAAVPESFPMTGEGKIVKNDVSRTLSGDEIPMERAASKISFYVTKVDNSDVDDKNWMPDTENMRVSYINGFDRGYLDANMDWADRSAGLFSYKGKARQLTSCTAEDGSDAGWTCEMPFWSLYTSWESEGVAPYLLLSVPWKYSSTDEQGNATSRYFTCYYAVPFNSIAKSLERNAWYKVSLSVSILGSGDPDDPTVVTPSYMILPWGNETVKTNAELLRYRYLMVDENSYVMNNVNSLSIPYYTSHPISVVSSSMTRTVLAPSSNVKYTPYEESVSSSAYSITTNEDNTAVVFTHDLVNDYSADYDVTAYTLTFTIRHTDNSNFTETLTVTQYPALYVVAELNSDCNTSHIEDGCGGSGGSWWSAWSNNSNAGYTYVNGSNSDSAGGRNNPWYSVMSDGTNQDPYRYVVRVSALPTGSPFTIGDPRSETVSNPTFSGSGYNARRSAPDIDGTGDRYLTNYYPTLQASSDANMIAPAFRIASSYGVTYAISFANATKRCATYQEDGYPAGRWRVPTQAEIWYMVKLASDKKIPELLTTTSYYWGGDGRAYRPSTDYSSPVTQTSSSYVRCVYDEWYWTDTCDKSTFTWGDRAR